MFYALILMICTADGCSTSIYDSNPDWFTEDICESVREQHDNKDNLYCSPVWL